MSCLIRLFAALALVTLCSCTKELGRDTCVFVDHVESKVNYNAIPCSNNTVCRNKHFRITYINVVPYVYVWNHTYWGIDEILFKCCGPCVQYTSTVLNNITELTLDVLEQSDIVFPILAQTSTKKLYGSHYLPYIHVPSVFYLTKNRDSLLRSLLNCYPIVALCLLLSIVSGFIAWLFERWENEDEFPKPFLIGCFEGFWWAFVSMTTVGYGDKTPKSIGARLFSIVWIMIGIIGFGLLTGQLTGEIVKANSPPSPTMKGKDVGVLRYRDHDAQEVVEKGGRVIRNTDVDNFYSDVVGLIEKLQQDDISGFVLDKWALAYVTLVGDKFMTSDQMDFFINHTTRTEKQPVGESHSYGILMRDKSTFQYFQEFVIDSQDRWAIISEEWWVSEQIRKFGRFESPDKNLLLSPSQPLFQKSVIAIMIMIGLTMAFGLSYELRKRFSKDGCKRYKGRIPIITHCTGSV